MDRLLVHVTTRL